MFEQQTYIEKDFSQQDLTHSVFNQCHFLRCNFSRTQLQDTQFIECVFIEQGDEIGCDFSYAKLQDVQFISCQLSLCSFIGANCFGAKFNQCDLKGADFFRTGFANQISYRNYFCSVEMTKCNLSYANFDNQCIEKCKLNNNRWIGANLQDASLSGSDLSGGEFSPESWRQFKLTGCDLTDIDLDGLDPRRVDLTGVKINPWQQASLLNYLGVVVV